MFKNEDYLKYQKMLARIFPNVNKFCDKMECLDIEVPSTKQIEKTRGIASAKYFDLYFSGTENQFSVLGGEIERYVKSLNEGQEDTKESFISILKRFRTVMHREILEALQLYVPEINKSALYDLVITLIECYWSIDDSSEFLMLNARQRCAVVIWEILRIIDEKEFEKILQYFMHSYEKIGIVNEVKYWFEKNNENKERYEKLEELEKRLVKEIVNNKINLYDDQYYHHKNIWGMCRGLKTEENVFKEYIMSNCTRKTVFRILYDIMGHSFGSGHRYYFQSNLIKTFFDEESLQEFMKDIETYTEDEQFIKQVYDAYISNPQVKSVGDSGVFSPEEVKLKML